MENYAELWSEPLIVEVHSISQKPSLAVCLDFLSDVCSFLWQISLCLLSHQNIQENAKQGKKKETISIASVFPIVVLSIG